MRKLLLFIFFVGCEGSDIKEDEVIVFFPSLGRVSDDGRAWRISIRGWVLEPEKDSRVRAALIEVFRKALCLDGSEAELARFKERAQPFVADNERGKNIAIRLGKKVYRVGRSGPNGHFEGTLVLTDLEVKGLLQAQGQQDRLQFEAALGAGEKRSFRGEAHLVEDSGLSIVSDIDDTIKVSGVKDRRVLLRNTFLCDYRAVPGMADLYARWAKKRASFHYVTASPWQLYEPLEKFIEDSGFPPGTLDMKSFRWKDSSFFDLFASPEEYKLSKMEPLLESFPRRRFILVGDSGEKDPEVYGALTRKYPDRVELILIRDTTGEAAGSERMKKAFEGLPAERWRLFLEPKELEPSR